MKPKLYKHKDYLHISYAWFGLKFILIGGVMFILQTYSLVRGVQQIESIFDWILIVSFFGGMNYYVLAGLLNKTHIFISNDTVAVKHGPIPWLGNNRIESSFISDIYCEKKTVKGYTNYKVISRLKDSTEVVLASDLRDEGHALLIANSINKYLDLKSTQAEIIIVN